MNKKNEAKKKADKHKQEHNANLNYQARPQVTQPQPPAAVNKLAAEGDALEKAAKAG